MQKRKFEKDDVIILNPVDDDLNLMESRMEERREKVKALRKLKKEKSNGKRKNIDETVSTENGFKEPAALTNGKEVVSKKSKKTKANGESSSSKLPSKKAASAKTNGGDISLDHTKSKVYKSLFTSSEGTGAGRDDKKAHWVTYNPYHL